MPLAKQDIRGVSVNYGPQKIDPKYGADVDDKIIKVVQWTFKYNDLPVPNTWNMEAVIPANSTILSAKLQIVEAFTSTSTTTDLTVGLRKKDNTGGDDDGLITAAQATQTAIAVKGSIIDGASGTAAGYINKTIGADPLELIVLPNVADLLTGYGRLIVEYLDEGFSNF